MHREDNSKYLLFIEPKNKSKVPINDELTHCLEYCISTAKQGTSNYSDISDKGTFYEGGGYRGTHRISDEVRSSNCDYLLFNGMITNSLASYYVRWHRHEIPATEMKKLKILLSDWKQ